MLNNRVQASLIFLSLTFTSFLFLPRLCCSTFLFFPLLPCCLEEQPTSLKYPGDLGDFALSSDLLARLASKQRVGFDF